MNLNLRNYLHVFFLCISGLIACCAVASPAYSASLIRDAEIEATLKAYARPLLISANLVPENVNIFIINDPAINAFVAGGSNIFIHTGLILAADDASVLLGVMAHEVGHIAGGHLAQGSEQLENATISTVISYILGAAAAVGGNGQIGTAVLSAGQHIAQRNFLSFSRMNEQAADQAGLQYLDHSQMSASGLLELMEKLRVKESLFKNQLDPYALTHPLSKERIAHIRGHLLTSDIPEKQVPTRFSQMHQRMVAKLKGFLHTPENTLAQYPASDQSVSARYARAVAYHRLSQTEAALKEMDALLTIAPKDPYYLELKGQILSETDRHKEALPYYKAASELLPEVALLKMEYGRELLSLSPPNYQAALQELKQSSLQDPLDATTWKLLAECYAALQQRGQAALAYAESALRTGKPMLALQQTKVALQELPPESPARLRAKDIQAQAIRLQEQDKKNKG